MYEEEEVESVVAEIKDVLGKFEGILSDANRQISDARANLNSVEAYATLIAAQNQIETVTLLPVIETLEGVLEDSGVLPIL